MANHKEGHRIHRVGWFRAAILGANDGIISTSSLLIGVAAAQSSHRGILIAGMAGLVAGAMSMAAGEYISVSSQADFEKSELEIEARELASNTSHETEELANIYVKRGLTYPLAKEVAVQLMLHNALEAHARDELGITEHFRARPIQAGLSSAASFTIGAALPLLVALLTPIDREIPIIFVMAIFFLASLGALAAKIGGSSLRTSAIRVTLWGLLAMLVSAGIGKLLGVVV